MTSSYNTEIMEQCSRSQILLRLSTFVQKSTLDIAFKLVISIAIHLSEVSYQSVYFRIQQTGIRLLLMRERATCLEVP